MDYSSALRIFLQELLMQFFYTLSYIKKQEWKKHPFSEQASS